MKFETGKTYATRLISNHESIIRFTVIKRTDKTVTVIGDFINDPIRNTPHVMRVAIFQDVENFKPWGRYSMCPVISAERPLLASTNG